MPVFISINLALSFLVQSKHSLLAILNNPAVFYIGSTIMLLSFLSYFFLKHSINVIYDLFLSATVLVWYQNWQPLFIDNSPIFYFYPIYFTFISAAIPLFIISQHQHIDSHSRKTMRSLYQKSRLQPGMIMLGISLSLMLPEHFLLYPITVTLLLLNHALVKLLE